MPRHFAVHQLLKDSPAELESLQEFARDPARTVDDCHEWLQAKGYTLSRSAVGTWKKEFNASDAYRASNEVAVGMMAAVAEGGAVSLTDAATLQVGQMVFEQMLRVQQSGQMETKELLNLSAALKNTITAKRHVEMLKEQIKGALVEAEKEAKAGGSAEAVVSKVREILGIG